MPFGRLRWPAHTLHPRAGPRPVPDLWSARAPAVLAAGRRAICHDDLAGVLAVAKSPHHRRGGTRTHVAPPTALIMALRIARGDGVRAVLHGLRLAVWAGYRPAIQVVAAQLQWAPSKIPSATIWLNLRLLLAVPRNPPAGYGPGVLEGHLCTRQFEPALQMIRPAGRAPQQLIGAVDIFRIGRKRATQRNGPLPSQNKGADVAGTKPGNSKASVHRSVGLLTQIVAIIENFGTHFWNASIAAHAAPWRPLPVFCIPPGWSCATRLPQPHFKPEGIYIKASCAEV